MNSLKCINIVRPTQVFAFFLIASSLLAAASDTTFQTPGVHDRLPVFHERLAERMTFPMSWLSGNFTNFDAWRTATRAKVMEHLLAAPPAAPFDARIVAEQD